MIPYRLCTLYSGSTGNATYVETPGARILIDAGKCARTLIASLGQIGVAIDTVDAIFITHEHTDHIGALEVLAKKHPIPVHMIYQSALRFKEHPPEALCACLQIHATADFTVRVGDVTVTAFPTPHDSRASVGYRMTVSGAGESDPAETVTVGYATDIGYITQAVRDGLLGCESVVLESNHDVEMLRMGRYPYDLKQRILSRRGHLSNRDCADFAAELCASGTRNILLAHLSEENNLPDIAYDETFSAVSDYSVRLAVASPAEVTMLVGEEGKPILKTCGEAVSV